MQKLNFKKIQATGNDFIVINKHEVPDKLFSAQAIKEICDRHFGIGADGLIALEKTELAAFRFHYFNSDGSRGEMCANGCRAAIRYALTENWLQSTNFTFVADDGPHEATFENDAFNVEVLVNPEIKSLPLVKYDLPSWIEELFFVHTGVPHLVLICKTGLRDRSIDAPGRYLRFHTDFKPAGTNVDFLEIQTADSIFVRTFERGVDQETLSCGTGVTASAMVANSKNKVSDQKISIETVGGYLSVKQESGKYYISGPAKIVFQGEWEI